MHSTNNIVHPFTSFLALYKKIYVFKFVYSNHMILMNYAKFDPDRKYIFFKK